MLESLIPYLSNPLDEFHWGDYLLSRDESFLVGRNGVSGKMKRSLNKPSQRRIQ